MRPLTHRPGPPLADFAELLWFHETVGGPHPKERLLPDGAMELVIDLHEGASRQESADAACHRGGVIIGARAESFTIDTSMPTAGVHFRPGGAFPFLRQPAGEFCGCVVSIDDVWGRDALDLREQLLEHREPALRFRLLERFLLDHATRPLARHPAVVLALKEFRSVPRAVMVAEVTDRVGLSQRRFIEVFRDQVGLTPKIYSRLHRFQHILRRLEAGFDGDLAGLAVDCGYYDQAHFNHDFKAFSGLCPSSFLARWQGRPNHVPLPD